MSKRAWLNGAEAPPLHKAKVQNVRLGRRTLQLHAAVAARRLFSYGDGGEEAAGAGALLAVAEEERGVAGGAEAGGKDIFFGEAGGEELRAIGFCEIEVNVFGRRLVAGGHPVEPLERIGLFAGARLVEKIGGIGELGCELNDEFGADFVTTRADGWADGGEQIGRI